MGIYNSHRWAWSSPRRWDLGWEVCFQICLTVYISDLLDRIYIRFAWPYIYLSAHWPVDLSCHAGLTPDGSNFAGVFPNFDAHYQALFMKFLSGIYRKPSLLLLPRFIYTIFLAESVCKSHALFSVEDDADLEGDDSRSNGKGLFRGLINANGDRISPTGLYSPYIWCR